MKTLDTAHSALAELGGSGWAEKRINEQFNRKIGTFCAKMWLKMQKTKRGRKKLLRGIFAEYEIKDLPGLHYEVEG